MIEGRGLLIILYFHNILKSIRLTNIYNTSNFKPAYGLDSLDARRVKINTILPFMKPKSKQAVRALKKYGTYGEDFEQKMMEHLIELMYDMEHVGLVVETIPRIISEAKMSKHEIKIMYANLHTSKVVFKRIMKILDATIEEFTRLNELAVKRTVSHHVCNCAYKELNRAKQKHGTLASAINTAATVSRKENKILGTYACTDKNHNTVWHIKTLSPHKWF